MRLVEYSLKFLILGFVLCIALHGEVWSFSMEGSRILQISSSGRSIMVNRGSLSGIRQGDKGKFIFQDTMESPHLHYLAFGEAIKVFANYSYWYLREIKASEFRTDKEYIILTSDTEVMEGRRPLRVLQRNVVFMKGDDEGLYQHEDESRGVPGKFAKKEHDFAKERDVRVTQLPKWQDAETFRFQRWKKGGPRYIREYFSELPKTYSDKFAIDPSLSRKERAKYKKRTFKKMSDGTVDKYNNLPQGLSSLYRYPYEKSRTAWKRSKILGNLNTYESYYEAIRKKQIPAPTALNKVNVEGPMWSADMTDAQLRRFIVENGLWEEAQRQDFARKYLPGHEFLLRYTSDFTYNVTVSDGNFQTSGHDFSLGYEFHLVKTTDVLRHWTVEWDIYTGSDYYNVGGMNVRSDEFTHRGMINWYFKHPPSSIHKWMVHLGTGIRIGNAKFVAPGLAKKYVYQVQSFPIWQLGVKYRFRAGDENDYLSRIGFGINSLIIYEQKALTVNDNLFDDIRGNLNVEDVKFSIGISLFF